MQLTVSVRLAVGVRVLVTCIAPALSFDRDIDALLIGHAPGHARSKQGRRRTLKLLATCCQAFVVRSLSMTSPNLTAATLAAHCFPVYLDEPRALVEPSTLHWSRAEVNGHQRQPYVFTGMSGINTLQATKPQPMSTCEYVTLVSVHFLQSAKPLDKALLFGLQDNDSSPVSTCLQLLRSPCVFVQSSISS